MSSEKFILRNTPGMTLFRTAFMRMLWVPFVYTVLNIVMVTSTMSRGRFAIRSYPETQDYDFEYLANRLDGEMHFFVIAIIIAALVGCTVFAYLNRVNSASFMHSLPVRREKLFFAHYAAGAAILVLPIFITSVVIGLHVESALYGLLFFLADTVYSIGVFSFATMVCQLSANTLGGLFFTGFGLFTPAILEGFFVYLMEQNLYGYTGQWSNYLVIRYCYLMPESVLSPLGLIYVGAIIAFTAVGTILYKKRNTELAGDLIAFPKIRQLLTLICGVLAGMCAYLIFGNLYMFLLFAVICVVCVNFAVRKKFTVKGALTPAIVATLLFGIVLATVKYDLTGFERRVPDVEDVVSVKVDNGIYYYPATKEEYSHEKGTIYYKYTRPEITESQNIEKVTELHRDLIGNKHFYSSGERTSRVNLEYTLKNGRKLRRGYILYYNHNAEAYESVSKFYEIKSNQHPILVDNKTYTGATLTDEFGQTYTFSAAEAQMLRDSVCRAITDRPYESDPDNTELAASAVAYIDFNYYRNDGVYKDTGDNVANAILSKYVDNEREHIYPSYTETIALISTLAPDALNFKIEEPDKAEAKMMFWREKGDSYGYTRELTEGLIENTEDIEKIAQICFELSGKQKAWSSPTMYRIEVSYDGVFMNEIEVFEENEELREIFSRAEKINTEEYNYAEVSPKEVISQAY